MPQRSNSRLLLPVLAGILALLGVAAAVRYAVVRVESRVVGVRPVYLQLVGPDTATLRWGTAQPASDTVFYGPQSDGLHQQVEEVQPHSNHRVTLHGLQADTRYHYRIRHHGAWLTDEAGWFVTSPVAGKARDVRVWILGDPGRSAARSPVRYAGLDWLRKHRRAEQAYLDLLLTTGDGAYPSGTTRQWLSGFFTPYRDVLKNVPVWPVLGNHDARRLAFYRLFDRPQHAELGGVASNTPGYFSFDYAQTHLVFLDTQAGDLTPPSPMLSWLEEDLRQTQATWTLVLLHHPPYTKGTHDSDSRSDSGGRMTRVRQNVLPILEAADVDLVIGGHSHDYERSHLLYHHYGESAGFVRWMIRDPGQQHGDEHVYTKNRHAATSHSGTMYIVLGASGAAGRGALNHPALPIVSDQPGSLVVDMDSKRLTARYITATGHVADRFTIEKPAQAAQP